MKPRAKALFVAEDVGGCKALIPVYKSFSANHPARMVAGSACRALFKGKVVHVMRSNQDREALLKRELAVFKPDLVVTCPGPWLLNLDKIAIRMAKESGIKSVGLIDYWMNYAARFSDVRTENLAYVPDVICAIDRDCARFLRKAGIASDRIFITGNPNLDGRKRIKAFAGKPQIAFFSQPFSELRRKDPGLASGLDEKIVFKDVLDALDAAGVAGDVVIKHHPRTVDAKIFNAIAKGSKRKITVDTKTSSDALIAKCDLVIGMNSMVLFEAALAGKPVLSYQPGLKNKDPLRSNRTGLTIPVYAKKNLLPALEAINDRDKTKKREAVRRRFVDAGATKKVMNVILNIV